MTRPGIPTILALILAWCPEAPAGGGASLAQDQCVIEMDFQSAHLTIYQPGSQGSETFCDSVPDAADTVFVLDYLHDSLNRVPVELRIIEDATGKGRFARWEDVEALSDIESHTVFHEPPAIHSGGSYQAEHEFREEGDYLILVTSRHPSKDLVYHGVSPLTVGATPWWYWLGVPVAGLVAGLGYFAYRRRRNTTEPHTDV